MKIKDLPKHQRPREKLRIKGVSSLKNAELLAILLRTGKKGKNVLELADNILIKHTLKHLPGLSFDNLITIKGIDEGKACTILAAFEFTRRALEVTEASLPIINTSMDVLNHVSHIRVHKKEHFIALYLNARNQVIQTETISVGTLNASIVHPREVFEPAIRVSAAQVILAHNHPSGNTDPSDADILITKRLVEVGNMLGIDILDHVIIAESGYTSLKSFIIKSEKHY